MASVDNTNRKFSTRCAPLRFEHAVSKFSDSQQAAVREIGFGSLLDIKCGNLRRDLCGWLVESFNPIQSTLVLQNQTFALSERNFTHIMGIENGGMPVDLNGPAIGIAQMRENFIVENKGIPISTLVEKMANLEGADFKVAFILFALGTILCPTSLTHVKPTFLHTLTNANTIRSRNWASFFYGQLVESIARFKAKEIKYVGGCVLFLQIFYMEAVVLSRQTDRDLKPLARWNKKRVSDFMRALKHRGGVRIAEVSIHQPVVQCQQQQCNDVNLASLIEFVNKNSVKLDALTLKVDSLTFKVDSLHMQVSDLKEGLKKDEGRKEGDADCDQPPKQDEGRKEGDADCDQPPKQVKFTSPLVTSCFAFTPSPSSTSEQEISDYVEVNKPYSTRQSTRLKEKAKSHESGLAIKSNKRTKR